MATKREYLWQDRKRIVLFALPFSFTTYAFDNERFYCKRGFFNLVSDEVRLYRIMDLSLRRSFFQRLSGLGTIIVESADKSMRNFQIANIKKPEEVMDQLSSLVEQERERKRVSSREYLHDDDFDDDDDPR